MNDTNSIQIRPARAKDSPAVVEMIRQLAAHHEDVAAINQEDLVFLCFGPHPWVRLLVAERDGVLLGYAGLVAKMQLQFARRIMDLHHLYVIPEARGQGVGSALIEASCSEAHGLGCEAMTVGVMQDNTRAAQRYEASGFRPSRGGGLQLVRRLDLLPAQGPQ